MSYDRADFLATVAKRRESLNREQLPIYQTVAAAAVVADKLLTDYDHWNRYVQILQGQVERIRAKRADAQRKLNDPLVIDDADVRKLRIDIFRADAWEEALTFAIELPKALFEDGQKAQDIINKFAGENDDSPTPQAP